MLRNLLQDRFGQLLLAIGNARDEVLVIRVNLGDFDSQTFELLLVERYLHLTLQFGNLVGLRPK